jgi:hypothetical protein
VLPRTASGALAREQLHWLGTRVAAWVGDLAISHLALNGCRTRWSRRTKDIVVVKIDL